MPPVGIDDYRLEGVGWPSSPLYRASKRSRCVETADSGGCPLDQTERFSERLPNPQSEVRKYPSTDASILIMLGSTFLEYGRGYVSFFRPYQHLYLLVQI